MSMFVLTSSWEFPAFPLLDEFIGDGIANEKGGVISVEEVKTEKVSLSKDSKEVDIQHYFEGVLELVKSDKEFPVDLDDVWMLAYSEKGKAVRALKSNFFENEDFRVFAQNGKNPLGGRPTEKFYLTVSCMEFFVARKVKAVFEVYRKVFHRVVNEIQKMTLPNFSDPAVAARAWADQYEKNQRLTLENKRKQEALEASQKEVVELSSTITQMQPKVSYVDSILQSKNTVTVTSIAQDYGETARKFNLILRDLKIQHKVGSQWIVYRDYLKEGYVQSKTFDYTHKDGSLGVGLNTVWTQKGRLFLYEFLKSKGILPLIERNDSGETHQ